MIADSPSGAIHSQISLCFRRMFWLAVLTNSRNAYNVKGEFQRLTEKPT
jgi:hypothetical protein